MAALHRELVSRRGWLAPDRYGLIFGLARAIPGTNLLAFCAGAAWQIRGLSGAVLAVAAATIPSAIAVVALTYAYRMLRNDPLAAAVIAATLSAAVGMMAAAALQIIRPGLTRRRAVRTAVLFSAACALLISRLMGPLQVLGLAAAAGLVWPEGE